MRPIYYDTETTGIKIGNDKITEIAAYDPEREKSFCKFVNPGMPIPKEATLINNITDEMVKDAPSFAIIGQEFIDFCGGDAILIAHNNDNFDKPMLEAEYGKINVSMPAWQYIDSLKWARKYRKDLPKHSLQYLREVYGVEANQAHRALDDVMVLYKVFSMMIDDLPIATVLELLKANNNDMRMPFGKHQGKPLKDVPK